MFEIYLWAQRAYWMYCALQDYTIIICVHNIWNQLKPWLKVLLYMFLTYFGNAIKWQYPFNNIYDFMEITCMNVYSLPLVLVVSVLKTPCYLLTTVHYTGRSKYPRRCSTLACARPVYLSWPLPPSLSLSLSLWVSFSLSLSLFISLSLLLPPGWVVNHEGTVIAEKQLQNC